MPVLVDILFFALASVFFTFAMSVIDRVLGISGIKCPICRGKSCKEKYFGGFFAIFACLKCGTRFVIDDGVSALPEELRAVRHPGLRAIMGNLPVSSGWSMTRKASHSWSTAVSESLSENGRFWARSWRRNGEQSC